MQAFVRWCAETFYVINAHMKLAIIGGGAAGLMAAASALNANPDAQIFLLEKNDGLGKKVIISGGGRCNVTTGITDVREVLKRYPRGKTFLFSAMYQFPPESVYTWFEEHGVPLKIEEDLRVFPQSNNGRDVVGVFEKCFNESDVRIWLKANVIRVEKTEEQFVLTLKEVTEPLIVDRVILTTGGQAYRQTGSTGDGYAFAQSLGHHLTPLAPSLNAFFTSETWPKELSGLSYERATISADRVGSPSYTGPFLFTHKGVSGPAVFALSSLVAFEAYDANQPLLIHIDLFPDQTADQLVNVLEEIISRNLRKNFVNILALMVPKSFSEVICRQLEIDGTRNVVEIGRKNFLRVMSWLKAIPLHAIARGAGDEFVTAGGIDLKEVDPSSMESKLCPGLFFAGEILDIDGFTGGFNLQASWATGKLAGESAAAPSLRGNEASQT